MNLIKKFKKTYRRRRYFGAIKKSNEFIDIPSPIKVYYGNKIEFNGAAYLGEDCFIDARGGLSIGNNVILAPRVAIFTYNHDFRNRMWTPYSPGILEKKVTIGEGVWIGFSSILLPGTTIGDNCVIGAGSVLSGNYPNNSLIGGNPARVIGPIEKDENPIPYQELMSKKRRWG